MRLLGCPEAVEGEPEGVKPQLVREGWAALFDDEDRRARNLAQLQGFLVGDE